MSGTWKEYKGTESILWVACPDDIKAGLKDENGAAKDGAAKDYQGYHYVVKKVNRKSDGQQFVFVERKPLTASPTPPSPPAANHYAERDAQIQKNVDERMQFDKARLEFDKQNKTALEGLTRALTEVNTHTLALLARTETLYEQVQIAVENIAKSGLFDTAAKILEKAKAQ